MPTTADKYEERIEELEALMESTPGMRLDIEDVDGDAREYRVRVQTEHGAIRVNVEVSRWKPDNLYYRLGRLHYVQETDSPEKIVADLKRRATEHTKEGRY
jgi:hypothetical protein